MELTLRNVGKIDEASITINGITIIAGENNTGKSTVGKALYCIFNAFHNIDDKINDERTSLIYRAINTPFRRKRVVQRTEWIHSAATEICKNKDFYLENVDELRGFFDRLFKSADFDVEVYEKGDIFDKILSYLKLDENLIKSNVLKKILTSEFDMQVSNINGKAKQSTIELAFHEKTCIDLDVIENRDINIRESTNIYSKIAYIEDPFVIDELESLFPVFLISKENHRKDIYEMLSQKREGSIVSSVMEEMVVSEKLNHIFMILNQICDGNLIKTDDSYAYSSSKFKQPLSLSNVSTGFKSFLILKTLLMNGSIEEGSTIILDEPEIHLHPEWQLVLAELIVLIYKEFGVHVLLNTHSPYFLRAIQVYSAKHKIADKCKYYLSELSDDISVITDVSDNIEKIYSKLSQPLQKLEDERWEDD